MKLLTLATLLTAICSLSVFSADLEIPKSVIDLHTKICPSFASEQAQYLTKEIYELKKSEFSPSSSKLIILGCEMYAYNTMEKGYFLDSYGDINVVAVTEVDELGEFSSTTNLMGAYFNPDTLELETSSRGRVMGDCGQSAVYKLNTETERFNLVTQALKVECDGSEEPWPTVFPRK